jgi:hypothetical protein
LPSEESHFPKRITYGDHSRESFLTEHSSLNLHEPKEADVASDSKYSVREKETVYATERRAQNKPQVISPGESHEILRRMKERTRRRRRFHEVNNKPNEDQDQGFADSKRSVQY